MEEKSTHKTVLNEKLTRKTLNFVYTINHLNAVVVDNYQKTPLGFLMKNVKTCRAIMIGILGNSNVCFFFCFLAEKDLERQSKVNAIKKLWRKKKKTKKEW